MDDRNSLWNIIKRFFRGRVAFIDPEADLSKVDADPPRIDLLHDTNGGLIRPELEMTHSIDRILYDEMSLRLDLTNKSKICLQVDRIDVLGSTKVFNVIIGPGETKQVEAYRGSLPVTSNNHYLTISYCELYSGERNVFGVDYLVNFVQYQDDVHYLTHGFRKIA